MMTIRCIHCGVRNVAEFRYAGESGSRPDPNAATPAEWHAYLYDQINRAGWTTERWFHASGCRRFFVIERHTETHEIRAVRHPGDASEPSQRGSS